MSDQLKIQIGQRIKAARSQRTLTQERLAEIADCHIDTLSLIERGKTLPSIDVLLRLSEALELDIAALLKGGVSSGKPQARQEAEAHFWALVSQMSDLELEKLKDMASVLLR
ncbi:MAG: hypothetical protein C0456_10695 [Hyphomonas sp.]|uniref:helix-turn-helix domain-containing protein n=1 Tax=Hyphomonas sp. TaxID=87 RepID=UPI001D8F90DA|nr:helix-turn-helix transcriptional regulator [Hyphomonas sp.]MBA4227087.1 hypothetical protein [Hyphomonas sp.]